MVNTVRRSVSLDRAIDDQMVLLAEQNGRSVSETAGHLIKAGMVAENVPMPPYFALAAVTEDA